MTANNAMHAELAAVPSSLYSVTRANRVIASVRAGMRSAGRFIQRLVLFVGIFVIAVVAEEAARLPFGGTMTIHGPRISNATVTGEWRPDFLWMGKAWSIDVCSDEGIELTLDGRIYLIPKGNHTVYSNHDHTNTGEFGTKEFWGCPKKVQVAPLEKEALTKR